MFFLCILYTSVSSRFCQVLYRTFTAVFPQRSPLRGMRKERRIRQHRAVPDGRPWVHSLYTNDVRPPPPRRAPAFQFDALAALKARRLRLLQSAGQPPPLRNRGKSVGGKRAVCGCFRKLIATRGRGFTGAGHGSAPLADDIPVDGSCGVWDGARKPYTAAFCRSERTARRVMRRAPQRFTRVL